MLINKKATKHHNRAMWSAVPSFTMYMWTQPAYLDASCPWWTGKWCIQNRRCYDQERNTPKLSIITYQWVTNHI